MSSLHVLTGTISSAHYHFQLRKNLFEDKYANAILAFSKEGQPIGLALYFFNFSTWTGRPGLYVSSPSIRLSNCRRLTVSIAQLEDLYVKPEFRGSGAGKALFGRLGKIAQEKVRLFLPTPLLNLTCHRPSGLPPTRLVCAQGALLLALSLSGVTISFESRCLCRVSLPFSSFAVLLEGI